jgi:hypothetical protein
MEQKISNKNTKMKFISGPTTLEEPIFRYYTSTFKPVDSIIYGADSKIKKNANINTNTQYTRNGGNADINKNMTSDFDKTFFPGFLGKGDPNVYSSNIGIENELKKPLCEVDENTKFKSNDGRFFTKAHDRRRNLDYSNHINPGLMINAGFGNIEQLSRIKYGENTRDLEQTTRDTEFDRFHFTFQDFQHEIYGSNPKPADTRYLNKKFNN